MAATCVVVHVPRGCTIEGTVFGGWSLDPTNIFNCYQTFILFPMLYYVTSNVVRCAQQYFSIGG